MIPLLQRLNFVVRILIALQVGIFATQPLSALSASCTNTGAGAASTWTPWECVLEVADTGTNLAGRSAYLNRLKVEFVAPGTYIRTGYAAWDGSRVVNGVTLHRFVIRLLTAVKKREILAASRAF